MKLLQFLHKKFPKCAKCEHAFLKEIKNALVRDWFHGTHFLPGSCLGTYPPPLVCTNALKDGFDDAGDYERKQSWLDLQGKVLRRS